MGANVIQSLVKGFLLVFVRNAVDPPGRFVHALFKLASEHLAGFSSGCGMRREGHDANLLILVKASAEHPLYHLAGIHRQFMRLVNGNILHRLILTGFAKRRNQAFQIAVVQSAYR
jgi:hypothetical protein